MKKWIFGLGIGILLLVFGSGCLNSPATTKTQTVEVTKLEGPVNLEFQGLKVVEVDVSIPTLTVVKEEGQRKAVLFISDVDYERHDNSLSIDSDELIYYEFDYDNGLQEGAPKIIGYSISTDEDYIPVKFKSLSVVGEDELSDDFADLRAVVKVADETVYSKEYQFFNGNEGKISLTNPQGVGSVHMIDEFRSSNDYVFISVGKSGEVLKVTGIYSGDIPLLMATELEVERKVLNLDPMYIVGIRYEDYSKLVNEEASITFGDSSIEFSGLDDDVLVVKG
ncbi:hypothetical protein Py04_1428 [Pyrococcus sp. ST04]|nr:hypothetical protein Py04_1428 [Pyrococcus sp. ST04]